jgi:hypothetical protein
LVYIPLAKKERHRRASNCHGTQYIIASQCTRISQSNCLSYPTYVIIQYRAREQILFKLIRETLWISFYSTT